MPRPKMRMWSFINENKSMGQLLQERFFLSKIILIITGIVESGYFAVIAENGGFIIRAWWVRFTAKCIT